jgi:predicted thioesterase
MTHTKRIVVDKARTIGFMGDALRVYSTPSMVLDLEQMCNAFLSTHLPADKSSVGAHVSVHHLGPTLLDMWVDISMVVTAIEGRKVTFEVELHDELDLVGKATHVRFVVELARQKERLEAKATRLGQVRK